MSKIQTLTPRFVDAIPTDLESGIIYISLKYSTASHSCCCGCGNKVVTALKKIGWHLIFIDKTVTLRPSIGNWNFPCQSHYFITYNNIQWLKKFTKEEIEEVRALEKEKIDFYYPSK